MLSSISYDTQTIYFEVGYSLHENAKTSLYISDFIKRRHYMQGLENVGIKVKSMPLAFTGIFQNNPAYSRLETFRTRRNASLII